MNDYIIINDNDNVLVTLRPFVKGEVVNGITLLNDVPQAHKVALVDIKENEDIIKYGNPIGHATKDIQKGEHVHVHNTKTNTPPAFGCLTILCKYVLVISWSPPICEQPNG